MTLDDDGDGAIKTMTQQKPPNSLGDVPAQDGEHTVKAVNPLFPDLGEEYVAAQHSQSSMMSQEAFSQEFEAAMASVGDDFETSLSGDFETTTSGSFRQRGERRRSRGGRLGKRERTTNTPAVSAAPTLDPTKVQLLGLDDTPKTVPKVEDPQRERMKLMGQSIERRPGKSASLSRRLADAVARQEKGRVTSLESGAHLSTRSGEMLQSTGAAKTLGQSFERIPSQGVGLVNHALLDSGDGHPQTRSGEMLQSTGTAKVLGQSFKRKGSLVEQISESLELNAIGHPTTRSGEMLQATGAAKKLGQSFERSSSVGLPAVNHTLRGSGGGHPTTRSGEMLQATGAAKTLGQSFKRKSGLVEQLSESLEPSLGGHPTTRSGALLQATGAAKALGQSYNRKGKEAIHPGTHSGEMIQASGQARLLGQSIAPRSSGYHPAPSKRSMAWRWWVFAVLTIVLVVGWWSQSYRRHSTSRIDLMSLSAEQAVSVAKVEGSGLSFLILWSSQDPRALSVLSQFREWHDKWQSEDDHENIGFISLAVKTPLKIVEEKARLLRGRDAKSLRLATGKGELLRLYGKLSENGRRIGSLPSLLLLDQQGKVLESWWGKRSTEEVFAILRQRSKAFSSQTAKKVLPSRDAPKPRDAETVSVPLKMPVRVTPRLPPLRR